MSKNRLRAGLKTAIQGPWLPLPHIPTGHFGRYTSHSHTVFSHFGGLFTIDSYTGGFSHTEFCLYNGRFGHYMYQLLDQPVCGVYSYICICTGISVRTGEIFWKNYLLPSELGSISRSLCVLIKVAS